MEPQDPRTLTHEDLADIVTSLQEVLFLDLGQDEPDDVWNPDKELASHHWSILVDVLKDYDLVPKN